MYSQFMGVAALSGCTRKDLTQNLSGSKATFNMNDYGMMACCIIMKQFIEEGKGAGADWTYEELLTHVTNETGYTLTFERITVVPMFGDIGNPGDRLDFDQLGMCGYIGHDGVITPQLEPSRLFRSYVSSKQVKKDRSPELTASIALSKIASLMFTATYGRPTWMKIMQMECQHLLALGAELSEENTEDMESLYDPDVIRFIQSQGTRLTDITQDDIHQFYHGQWVTPQGMAGMYVPVQSPNLWGDDEAASNEVGDKKTEDLERLSRHLHNLMDKTGLKPALKFVGKQYVLETPEAKRFITEDLQLKGRPYKWLGPLYALFKSAPGLFFPSEIAENLSRAERAVEGRAETAWAREERSRARKEEKAAEADRAEKAEKARLKKEAKARGKKQEMGGFRPTTVVNAANKGLRAVEMQNPASRELVKTSDNLKALFEQAWQITKLNLIKDDVKLAPLQEAYRSYLKKAKGGDKHESFTHSGNFQISLSNPNVRTFKNWEHPTGKPTDPESALARLRSIWSDYSIPRNGAFVLKYGAQPEGGGTPDVTWYQMPDAMLPPGMEQVPALTESLGKIGEVGSYKNKPTEEQAKRLTAQREADKLRVAIEKAKAEKATKPKAPKSEGVWRKPGPTSSGGTMGPKPPTGMHQKGGTPGPVEGKTSQSEQLLMDFLD
jgi:hypothetical protein